MDLNHLLALGSAVLQLHVMVHAWDQEAEQEECCEFLASLGCVSRLSHPPQPKNYLSIQ